MIDECVSCHSERRTENKCTCNKGKETCYYCHLINQHITPGEMTAK